ncbi:MAG TPA: NUDIX domain-containing protein [Bacteroidota bacterium]
MPKVSAGLLLYRKRKGVLEVLLVHPGGPLWAKKDDGSWSLPKGEIEKGEEPVAVARREFREETGFNPDGDFIPLGSITQASGKIVHAWAVEGDLNARAIKSNTFPMEWPPHSGKQQEFPEVDRAEWFPMDPAKKKINKAQVSLLERLQAAILSSL